jgi:hypothetical protein
MAKNFGIPDDSPILTGQSKPEDAPVPPVSAAAEPITLSMDQLSAIVAMAVKTAMEGSAEANAFAMKKALKPENDPAPMISAFNPAGDRDHPRPKLKCEFTLFDGIPIDGTTDTVEELELMNKMVAGDYFVSKSDGTLVPFKVREIRNDLGQLRRIDLSFPYRDESDRAGVLPMAMWLRDVVRQIERRNVA